MPPRGVDGGQLGRLGGFGTKRGRFGAEGVRGRELVGERAPPHAPRNMDTFCRPVAPAQQWQHDKSETRSNPR